ncbi:hypothetical protein CEXT_763801 [Caerostris extrusa]|uniref:Uncharacterized protein n=1 Tax=Caerostris extrusa TaxID=172846 RepID=A0AAV4Y5X2_CAEEX|nr:hypothetical protein CEXT_763801 [Caerostris extrusa]
MKDDMKSWTKLYVLTYTTSKNRENSSELENLPIEANLFFKRKSTEHERLSPEIGRTKSFLKEYLNKNKTVIQRGPLWICSLVKLGREDRKKMRLLK